jgi:hypothetical protein
MILDTFLLANVDLSMAEIGLRKDQVFQELRQMSAIFHVHGKEFLLMIQNYHQLQSEQPTTASVDPENPETRLSRLVASFSGIVGHSAAQWYHNLRCRIQHVIFWDAFLTELDLRTEGYGPWAAPLIIAESQAGENARTS